LHMFSDFFETKPISKLLAKNIEAHHLTDDVLGRTLDALFEADVSILSLYTTPLAHNVNRPIFLGVAARGLIKLQHFLIVIG